MNFYYCLIFIILKSIVAIKIQAENIGTTDEYLEVKPKTKENQKLSNIFWFI